MKKWINNQKNCKIIEMYLFCENVIKKENVDKMWKNDYILEIIEKAYIFGTLQHIWINIM